ncbi:hypothetical protein FDECE_10901 [Fusarium decemcellulare]|nr:hypothetical protein FDECE_10901 [Fusarium decemcellulare]
MTFLAVLCAAAAYQALIAYAIGCTTPASPLRPAVTAAMVPLTWLFNQAIQGALESRLHVALLSTTAWIQCLKTFDDLCLTRLSYDGHCTGTPVPAKASSNGAPKASPQDSQGNFTSRLIFGFESLWNMRGIGTKKEISQIPPWSNQDPCLVPCRSRELRRHTKNAILSYLVLDVFANQPPPDLENMMSPRNEKLLTRLADIGAEEAIFRLFATSGFWLNTYCVIQLINSVIALLYLGLNLYPVQKVPPIWGKLADAYSIRRFWGNLWHQTLRRPLTSVSEFLAHTVLHMPKGTLVARYLKLFICFFISGALHVPADLSLGISTQESGVVTYFVTTALVIMCEDCVQQISRQLLGAGHKWRRYFGYAWVCCYMYWMTPSWGYPAARVVQPKDQLVSFSLIRLLKQIKA